jgi:transcriptional regulator with XRE-family HTH domain
MIGSRLKEWRKGKGLSQQALATVLNTSSGYISEIEQGKTVPGGNFLVSLNREFHVDINWLLSCEEKESTPPISPRAVALVDNFEAMSEKDKCAFEHLVSTVAKSGKKVTRKAE